MASLRRNVASLGALQAANYLLPLMVVPYLARTLGAHAYGRLAFAQAVIQYCVLAADYGFNLTATQQVAVCREDRRRTSEIFWTTLAAKGALAGLGAAALVLAVAVTRSLDECSAILASGYLGVAGTVLFPVWLFPGLEQMGLITVSTLVARFSIIPLTFVLVKGPGDVAFAAGIQGGAVLGSGAVALGIIRHRRMVQWVRPSVRGVRRALANGWHVFLSLAAVSLYTTSNTVILRFVAGEKAVGYFAAANQIRVAACGLYSPLAQAVYPRISAVMTRSKDEAIAIVRKVLMLQGGAMLVVSTTLLAAAPLVVRLLLGANFAASVPVLYWLAPLPFVIGLSNVFGIQTMLPLGMHRTFSRILMIAGAMNVLLVFALSSLLAATGTAISVLATELFVTGAMATVLVRRKVPIFGQTGEVIGGRAETTPEPGCGG